MLHGYDDGSDEARFETQTSTELTMALFHKMVSALSKAPPEKLLLIVPPTSGKQSSCTAHFNVFPSALAMETMNPLLDSTDITIVSTKISVWSRLPISACNIVAHDLIGSLCVWFL